MDMTLATLTSRKDELQVKDEDKDESGKKEDAGRKFEKFVIKGDKLFREVVSHQNGIDNVDSVFVGLCRRVEEEEKDKEESNNRMKILSKSEQEMMPPPQSPARRARGTPRRGEPPWQLSPRQDSPSVDLLQEDDFSIFTSESQATPGHLFSPSKQQGQVVESLSSSTPSRPRYQNILIEYNQPKSVEAPHLDTWLNSPLTPGNMAVNSPLTPGTITVHPGPVAKKSRAVYSPMVQGNLGFNSGMTQENVVETNTSVSQETLGYYSSIIKGNSGVSSSIGQGNMELNYNMGQGNTGISTTLGQRNLGPNPSIVLGNMGLNDSGAPHLKKGDYATLQQGNLMVYSPVTQHALPQQQVSQRHLGINAGPKLEARAIITPRNENISSLSNEADHSISSGHNQPEPSKQPKNSELEGKDEKSSKNSPVLKCYSQLQMKQSPDEVTQGTWRWNSAAHSSDPFVPVVMMKVTDDMELPMGVIIEKEDLDSSPSKSKDKKIIKKERNKDEEVKNSKTVNYRCSDCGRRCYTLKDVREHDCLPKVECEDCKPAEVKVFRNNRTLAQHLAQCHPARSVQCPLCDKKVSSKTKLKDHIANIHPNSLGTYFGRKRPRKVEPKDQEASVDPNFDAPTDDSKETSDHDLLPEQADEDSIDVTTTDNVPEYLTVIEDNLYIPSSSDLIVVPFTTEGLNTIDTEIVESSVTFLDKSDDVIDRSQVDTSYLSLPDPEHSMCSSFQSLQSPPKSVNSLYIQSIDSPFQTVSNVGESTNISSVNSTLADDVRSSAYTCDKCGKGFNTLLRQRHHIKMCQINKQVSGRVKRERSGARQRSGANNRLEQLKEHWKDLLQEKERCAKCGRINYMESNLTSHKSKCKGTLLVGPGPGYGTYQCSYCPDEPKRMFCSEPSLASHVSTSHLSDLALEKYLKRHPKPKCRYKKDPI